MARLLGAASLLVAFAIAPIALADPPRDPAPALESIDPSLVQSAVPEQSKKCCKICHKGKACGDTCIARSKTCTQPPGCACDG